MVDMRVLAAHRRDRRLPPASLRAAAGKLFFFSSASSRVCLAHMQPPSREPPSEAAAPWYLTADQIEASPSREYFVRKYGSVERARIREQESRLTTCAFLQESGQKLRLCV